MKEKVITGEIRRKMSGEICIDGIRLEAMLKQYMGQYCTITIILEDEE